VGMVSILPDQTSVIWRTMTRAHNSAVCRGGGRGGAGVGIDQIKVGDGNWNGG
jgi:hypothetical protein